ncbi:MULTISPECIES: GNAT family N-acetyltransferase [Pseudomonas]|uniref:GNAT family N-acetyltransferase n=1 Tax=Pseudomonas TaxID=286 RepID=UPI000F473AE6|nr:MULTISPECIES: GNAT family N-acetyltransferase [Pseudomonas]MDD1022348.1 GNAT family N-acetyltransferase [Pseudomonas idahonensis]MDP9536539.1 GNAT family N-acetyltransferase [Pseudomonas protegens]ROL89139.1 GNAT family N-acetyltransferase [Pseudomonas protegens]ROM00708.1 GNAT family N-acetyltransferase [Pseudomonas protegens]ROM02782.1 GNAT family N-acetyltransferase [Pseudomonas protegens]
MECQVRPALEADAARVSQVILAALLTSNAQDYPASVIERVQASFTTDSVRQLMQRRQMFVALVDGELLGTASLDGRAVRSVFVDPAYHGHGLGRQLMAAVEQAALDSGLTSLVVPSSITAEGFYARLGFVRVREHYEGEELTLIMERALSP